MTALKFRFADSRDVPLLADANAQLIEDEGYEWKLSREALVTRWSEWLGGEYSAVVFEHDGPVAYALYRPSEHGVYLRQFFVWPNRRRGGRGREAIQLLAARIWEPGTRVEVDVLCGNQAALDFWKALGFRDYAIRLALRTAL